MFRMRALAVVAFVLLQGSAAFAQATPTDAQPDRPTGFAVGWEIASFANNYGFGVRVDTPPFADETVQIQLAADVAWVQGVSPGTSDTTWAPYTLVRIGIVRRVPIRDLPLHFYGGGGVALLFPTHKVSEKTVQGGGYGVTGLELSLPQNGRSAWFAELGGMGTGAKADQLANDPIYANGFTIAWGFRYRF
jgi:hypothetical protein